MHPRQITELSVGHVPEDRHRDGLILEMMISENIALQTYYKEPHSKNGILNYSNITSYAKKLMEEFDVRAASELVPAAALSGGNQQKQLLLVKLIEILISLSLASQLVGWMSVPLSISTNA